MADDDTPPCTLAAPPAISTCYCTRREGCPFEGDEDWGDEPDDDAGHGDDWPPGVVTEHTFAERGLL